MKKKIVVIGGGNGSAISINALKQNIDNIELSAVISMSDSTGSSGSLRKEFNTLPAGDILRAILAMSKYDYTFLKQIFYSNRFSGAGKLDNHDLGNIFLVLAEQYAGDWMSAVRALEQAVEAAGHVYPASLGVSDLIAELDNGDIVKTEGLIDRPEYDRSLRIKKLGLEPRVEASEEAVKVIGEADYIILGPGSLYTSIVASILPLGIKEAINKSNAKLIQVVGNAYEGVGETGPTKLSDFVGELEMYLPRKIDVVIANDTILDSDVKKKYEEKKWYLVDFDLENIDKSRLVFKDFEKEEGGLDPNKLGKILKEIII